MNAFPGSPHQTDFVHSCRLWSSLSILGQRAVVLRLNLDLQDKRYVMCYKFVGDAHHRLSSARGFEATCSAFFCPGSFLDHNSILARRNSEPTCRRRIDYTHTNGFHS